MKPKKKKVELNWKVRLLIIILIIIVIFLIYSYLDLRQQKIKNLETIIELIGRSGESIVNMVQVEVISTTEGLNRISDKEAQLDELEAELQRMRIPKYKRDFLNSRIRFARWELDAVRYRIENKTWLK